MAAFQESQLRSSVLNHYCKPICEYICGRTGGRGAGGKWGLKQTPQICACSFSNLLSITYVNFLQLRGQPPPTKIASTNYEEPYLFYTIHPHTINHTHAPIQHICSVNQQCKFLQNRYTQTQSTILQIILVTSHKESSVSQLLNQKWSMIS